VDLRKKWNQARGYRAAHALWLEAKAETPSKKSAMPRLTRERVAQIECEALSKLSEVFSK